MNTKLIRFTQVLSVLTVSFLMAAGCSQENKEAVPHTSPATVQQARQNNIEKVKNHPQMSAAEKEKALQYMGGGGAGAPKPLGATSEGSKP